MQHRSTGSNPLEDDEIDHTLASHFEEHLQDSGLIESGDSVLVAVSGGLDSMTLLALLASLRERWVLDLGVAHFDHRLREESGAEAEWVANYCRLRGLPIELGEATTRLRGQAEARQARYEFLVRAAERRGATSVATAHHADDQAETVLFHIGRGTGLRGLAGIPARRGRLIRPLLPFWRAELEAYANAMDIPFLEDPSNLLPSYTRNRIRLELLPLMEEIIPGAARSLVRLAGEASSDLAGWGAILDEIEPEVVNESAEGMIILARPRLLSYHPRIRVLLVRRLLRRLGSRPDRSATEAVLEFIHSGESGGEIEIAGGVRLAREFDHFRLSRVAERYGPGPLEVPLQIPGPESGAGVAVLGGERHLQVHWSTGDEMEPVGAAAFDPAGVRFPLEIRGWRPGDRIRMSYGTKKLTKLFVEDRIGRADRARIPILAEVGGRVLWVIGVARSVIAMPEPGRPTLHVIVTDTESSGRGRGTH